MENDADLDVADIAVVLVPLVGGSGGVPVPFGVPRVDVSGFEH